MISANFQNLYSIDPLHGLSVQEIDTKGTLIDEYLKRIEKKAQGFYRIVENPDLLERINNFYSERKNKYDHFIVLGIGGSALGTSCIQQTLTPLFGLKNLYVIDNIDPVMIEDLEQQIDLSKTLFIVVSKSGETPETLAQFFYFKEKCLKMYYPPEDHFVIVTDPKKGLLRKIAGRENIPSFEIPENVGGRFSVLTAVGLLPAKLMGFDIEKLLEGAVKMRGLFFDKNIGTNLPFKIAAIQYLLSKKGKNINVLMPYAQKLVKFADWYRQLLAESIGKKLDNNGQEIYTGITPVNGLGVTDQHSQSQLYNEGPNDKLHIFIKAKTLDHRINIPNIYPEEKTAGFLSNVSFNQLIEVEMEGTVQALTKNNRPNITIEIDRIDEDHLGGLFMLFECATAFLGEFFNINAYDQPGVELSKTITKKLLSQNE